MSIRRAVVPAFFIFIMNSFQIQRIRYWFVLLYGSFVFFLALSILAFRLFYPNAQWIPQVDFFLSVLPIRFAVAIVVALIPAIIIFLLLWILFRQRRI